jgi:CheY-like chemotaxis protein
MFRLLIVDDSDNLRKVIKRYVHLWNKDVEVFEARDGIEAETILQEKNFEGSPIQVIMLDWIMPRMTGHDLLKKIRDVVDFKTDPRIIMLTAETYPEQIQAIKKFGVTEYLLKPFGQSDLFEALDKVRDALSQTSNINKKTGTEG